MANLTLFIVAFSKVVSSYVTTDGKFCFGFMKEIHNFIEHSILLHCIVKYLIVLLHVHI